MATPDFDQIAEDVIARPGEARYVIAEQLREVWNARGAADLEAYRAIGNSSPGDIVRVIRELDR